MGILPYVEMTGSFPLFGFSISEARKIILFVEFLRREENSMRLVWLLYLFLYQLRDQLDGVLFMGLLLAVGFALANLFNQRGQLFLYFRDLSLKMRSQLVDVRERRIIVTYHLLLSLTNRIVDLVFEVVLGLEDGWVHPFQMLKGGLELLVKLFAVPLNVVYQVLVLSLFFLLELLLEEIIVLVEGWYFLFKELSHVWDLRLQSLEFFRLVLEDILLVFQCVVELLCVDEDLQIFSLVLPLTDHIFYFNINLFPKIKPLEICASARWIFIYIWELLYVNNQEFSIVFEDASLLVLLVV